MASSDDSDVIMMIRNTSFNGYPIKDACSNSECFVMTTFDGCVYTCDLTDINKQEKYVKVFFPTSEEDGDPDIDIMSVCCGRYHFLALSNDGRVYSWGKNNVGQLGIPKKKQKHKKQHHTTQDLKPRLIKGLSKYDVIQIACGDDHSLALTRDGRLFSWGSNLHGQLSVETKGQAKRAKHHVEKPTEIEGLLGVPLQHIVAGGDHSVALSTSRSVFVWGRNAHGQLGLQQLEDVNLPVKLGYLSQGNVKDVCCGTHHTSFLKENGTLLVYGIGVDRYPCESDEWSDSELRPGQPTGFLTFSFLQSTCRCTYVVDKITGAIFVLSHDEVRQDGPSGSLHLESLEESSITDLFETDSQTEWPPGRYVFDPTVWEPSKPVEDFETFDEGACRNDVAEADEVETEIEQQGGTVTAYDLVEHKDSVGCTTEAHDSTEHGFMSDDGDEDGDFSNCKSSIDDAYSDNDSFVTCDEDFASTACDGFPDGLEVGGTHMDCVSVKNEPTLQVESLVPARDVMNDHAAALDAASVSDEDDCPEKETLEDEYGRPPRSWRRICTGMENIFIIEHDELVGEEVHISVIPRRKIDTLSAELLKSLNDMTGELTEESALFQYASMVFSSPACLNASFQQTGPHEVNGLNVDLKAVRKTFESINKNTQLLQKLSEVIYVDLCKNAPQSAPYEETLRFYPILMECPIFSNPHHSWGRRVLAAVGRLMGFLPKASPVVGEFNAGSVTLGRWWKYEPMSFRRTITAYRLALTFLIRDRTLLERELDNFWTYLKVLTSLNEVNLRYDILSIKTFYIPKLDEVDFQPQNYAQGHPLSMQNFAWMTYPFLMDLELKTSLLASSNLMEQLIAMGPEIIQQMEMRERFPFFEHLLPPLLTMPLHLTVNRDDIFGRSVREQLAEMLGFPRTQLQKPLRVTFEGESGVDEGALSREFFRLVFEELLDQDRNDIFRYINSLDSTHSPVWFRKECQDAEAAEMCGLLFGLSLYNKATVPLPFPQLLYAKLLGKGPKSEMEEAAKLDKEFTGQMSKLLNGSEEYVMGCCDGEEVEQEDGQRVEVTKENVHLYVEKLVREYLAPSQFAAFQQGFNRVYNPGVFDMFRPIELETLVIGEKYFDWKSLQQSTQYVQPYTNSHSTIKMFWEVFHALDDDMKRKFLVFIAGSDRVPVGGLRNFGLHIDHIQMPRDDSVDDDEPCDVEDRLTRLLPRGRGCDNYGYRRTLRLPMYNSLELMEDRLTVALSHYDCPFHIA